MPTPFLMNQDAKTTYISGILIADMTGGTNAAPGNSADALSSGFTQISDGGLNYNIAACLELQSTQGALVVPRMTNTQRDAMNTSSYTRVGAGSVIFSTTDNQFQFYDGTNWDRLPAGGGGAVQGPASSTDNAVVRWDGTTGNLVQDSSVSILDVGGAVANRLILNGSATGNPVGISVTGEANTGISITPAGTGGILAGGLGAIATPMYSFTADTNTGMWSSAADTLDFSVGAIRALQLWPVVGAQNYLRVTPSSGTNAVVLQVDGAGGSANLNLLPKLGQVVMGGAGSVTAPIVAILGDLNTGIYSSAADTLNFSAGGVCALQLETDAAAVNYATIVPSATGSSVQIQTEGGDANVSLRLNPKGTGQVLHPDGAAATPSISFATDLDTGMFADTANTLQFSTAGALSLTIDPNANLGIRTETFGTNATNTFAIQSGTAPTTGVADTIQIYSSDLSAGNTMLSLYTEGTAISNTTITAADKSLAIRVNGTVYYIPCKLTND